MTRHSKRGSNQKKTEKGDTDLTLKIQDEIISKSSRMRSSRGSLTDCATSSSSSSSSSTPSSPSSPSSSVVSSRSSSPEATRYQQQQQQPPGRSFANKPLVSSQLRPGAAKVTPPPPRLFPSSGSGGGGQLDDDDDDDGLSPEKSANRFAQLSYEQVKKLEAVLEEVVPVHGRGNFPTLEIKLKDLVRVVRTRLEKDSIRVRDIRLNGGATTCILSSESTVYNDLDVIFSVDLSGPRAFDKVKTAVLDSLLDFMPEGVCKKRIGGCILKEAYVHKMVKVPPRDPAKGQPAQHHPNGDRWSLISLRNNRGRNVELKFVDTMRRQFEFSVDSFQIILDSLLTFYGCAGQVPQPTEHFYPTVIGESVYGDFEEALDHLEEKLISTRRPEEIRGGGLLKYCHLLVKGYRAANPARIKRLERYMCSRFFIDFGDPQQQRAKLEAYLTNHFVGDVQLRCEYLATLYGVVDESTICLMGHERRQTLCLIQDLAFRVYYFDHQRRNHPHQQHQQHQHQHLQQTETSAPTFSPAAAALVAGGGRFVLNGAIFYTPYMPTTGFCAAPSASTNGSNKYGVCACGWLNCR